MEILSRGIPENMSVASEAVADAMMTVQNLYYRTYVESEDAYKMLSTDTAEGRERIESNSRGRCKDSSLYVINYLLTHFPEEFTHYSIIEGKAVWDTELFKYNPNHQWHAYFLVKDKSQIWHAGSPANYNPMLREGSLLTRHLESENLAEIIGTIRERDGGIWLDADMIEQEIELIPKPESEQCEGSRGSYTMLSVPVFDLDSCGGLLDEFRSDGPTNPYHFHVEREMVFDNEI